MFEDREMYREVAETVGKRPAKAALLLAFVAAVCGSLTIIVGSVYLLTTRVIQPLVAAIPAAPADGIQAAAIAFGVSALIVSVAIVVLYRWWKRWDGVMTRAIENYVTAQLHPITEELKHLQENTAGLESVRKHDAWVEERLDSLEKKTVTLASSRTVVGAIEKRLQTLEPEPLPIGLPTSIGDLLGSMPLSSRLRAPCEPVGPFDGQV